MTRTRTPKETFLALVHGLCDGRIDEVVDLYSNDTHVVHPFDPLRSPPLVGRDVLRQHFSHRPDPPILEARPANIRIHETADAEVIVAEFSYEGTVIATGQAFSYPCIFVMRVRDGLIIESRDYVDHWGSARARGAGGAFIERLQRIGVSEN